MTSWRLVIVGGPYDGTVADSRQDPADVLIVWTCASPFCGGVHATFDPNDRTINVRTVESYRRQSIDFDAHFAVYEHGETVGPEVTEFESATAGLGSVEGDPYDPRAW